MKTVDFSRSFLTFRIDQLKREPLTISHEPPFSLNNARIQIECRLLVTDKLTHRSEEFVLGASCKTERVGVASDIWLQPNADFAPVFSRRQFMVIKTYDHVGQTTACFPPSRGVQRDRQSGLVADGFDNLRIDLAYHDGDVLTTSESIVDAILSNEPLTGRTVLATERFVADLQYPLKTINANERDGIYQTDTGPVLLPDLSRDWDTLIDGMELAYSAFNCADWIEFIVRKPTPIAEGISVYHYSHAARLASVNQVVRAVARREAARPEIAAKALARAQR